MNDEQWVSCASRQLPMATQNPELGHDRLSFVMCHGGSGADGASGSSVVVQVPSDYVMANSWE
jgi:hypothetical protein